MKKFTIKLADVEYIIKLSFRSLMTYEDLSGKPYNQISSLKDTLIYMYSCIISSNDITITWDAFLDAIDEDQKALEEFLQRLNEDNLKSNEQGK